MFKELIRIIFHFFSQLNVTEILFMFSNIFVNVDRHYKHIFS